MCHAVAACAISLRPQFLLVEKCVGLPGAGRHSSPRGRMEVYSTKKTLCLSHWSNIWSEVNLSPLNYLPLQFHCLQNWNNYFCLWREIHLFSNLLPGTTSDTADAKMNEADRTVSVVHIPRIDINTCGTEQSLEVDSPLLTRRKNNPLTKLKSFLEMVLKQLDIHVGEKWTSDLTSCDTYTHSKYRNASV